jgi:hypothetical protein
MSLINEALKKAQKQRTGDTPSLTEMPAIGGESASRIARRGKPAGFNTLILRISLGVAALAIVGVGAVLILRRPAAPAPATPLTSAPPPITTPASTVVAAPTALTQPVETPPLSAPVTAPVNTLPMAPNSPPVRAVPPVTPPSTTVVFAPVEAPKPVETSTIQLAPEPVRPAVIRKLEPRAINFVNSIRVAGIRASASDSKVLMNDRVYRVGDTVEAEMGLKLAGITANSLTFEDENGGRFTRNF